MAQVIPTNQTSTLSPYSGKLFEFNNSDSRVYISRAINSLLNVYGDNVVINGFIPSTPTMVGSVVSSTVSAGSAIADQTLVESTTPTTVSYDTAGLVLANASIAIFLDFQYLQQFIDNPFVLRTQFVQANGATLASDPLDLSRSRILLGVITFDAAGALSGLQRSNTYDAGAFRNNANTKSIDGTGFSVYPRSAISDTFSRTIRDTFL